MCLIIDANVASEFDGPSPDALPVLEVLAKGQLRLVSSSELKQELLRTRIRRLYQQLLLAGVLVEIDSKVVADAQKKLDAEEMKSDDPHVLALANASGARILFSRDVRLHEDFKNKKLISGAKGRIYQKADHRHVLKDGVCTCG